MKNFDEMSDEDLRKYILEPSVESYGERKKLPPPEIPSPIKGMSSSQLVGAGLKKSVADPFYEGPRELARTIWRGSPSELEKFNAEKAKRQEYEHAVMGTFPGQLGHFLGKVGTSLLAPSRMLPQVLLSGATEAMSPSAGPVKGTADLLTNRAMQGLEGAGTSAVVGAALSPLGKLAGYMGRKYTPRGEEALRLDAAARRLGVERTIGGLDPSSALAGFEASLPSYAKTVEKQVGQFSKAAQATKDIPSKSGRSTEKKVLEGEKVREAIQNAGQDLQSAGKNLWGDLDSYVVQNNLPPVKTSLASTRVQDIHKKFTPTDRKGMPDLDKNPVLQRVEEYDPSAASTLKTFLNSTGKNPVQVSFSDIHNLQTAVGKAMARAEKDAEAPGASMLDRQSKTELRNLYGSLMSDVDSWGTKNPQAQDMFNTARSFWRDVVVPGTITNKTFQKASRGTYGQNIRGYSEPSQLYSDVVRNPRAMQELSPYMTQEGRDLVDTLSTMPDVSRQLITRQPHPPAPGMGLLTTTAGMAVGSPLQLMKGILSNLPGFEAVMRSTPGKRMYFSQDVLSGTPAGKAAWGLSQEPQREMLRSLRGSARGLEEEETQ